MGSSLSYCSSLHGKLPTYEKIQTTVAAVFKQSLTLARVTFTLLDGLMETRLTAPLPPAPDLSQAWYRPHPTMPLFCLYTIVIVSCSHYIKGMNVGIVPAHGCTRSALIGYLSNGQDFFNPLVREPWEFRWIDLIEQINFVVYTVYSAMVNWGCCASSLT